MEKIKEKVVCFYSSYHIIDLSDICDNFRSCSLTEQRGLLTVSHSTKDRSRLSRSRGAVPAGSFCDQIERIWCWELLRNIDCLSYHQRQPKSSAQTTRSIYPPLNPWRAFKNIIVMGSTSCRINGAKNPANVNISKTEYCNYHVR